jgi:hypothetical protein
MFEGILDRGILTPNAQGFLVLAFEGAGLGNGGGRGKMGVDPGFGGTMNGVGKKVAYMALDSVRARWPSCRHHFLSGRTLRCD